MKPPGDTLEKAKALLSERRFAQAEQLLVRHLKREATDADALDLLGMCYAVQLYKDRARYYFDLALKARPGDVHISLHLAESLAHLAREAEAAELLLPLAKKHPGDAFLCTRAAKLLGDAGRLDEAWQVIESAIALSPDDAGLLHCMGRYYNRVGDSDNARRTFLRLQKIAPNEHGLSFTIANALNYNPEATRREQYIAHAAAARVIELSVPEEPFKHAPSDDPSRKLKIGFVSPDFRCHSVAYFVEPLLRNLDRDRFSLHGYYTRTEVDSYTVRIRDACDTFVSVMRADHKQLASKIHSDGIDILFDLCGLFAGHSLATMFLKPAPIQITYLGYPNTTGISAIDYRIVDSITDPPSQEKYAAETLLRLDPCFLCYGPDSDFHAVAPSVPRREGPFTFGCFNIATKLSNRVIEYWASVLRQAPDSRLFIKSFGMEEEPVRDRLRGRMASAGMPLDRVRIVGRVADTHEHLSLYRDVDLSLDSFPYNGTTTTCESLFMGVPVLTLSGITHASRVSASLLNATGLGDFICNTPEDYCAKAVALAGNRERLASARSGLRDRFLASPVCDAAAHGKRMSELLIRAWEARCRGERLTG